MPSASSSRAAAPSASSMRRWGRHETIRARKEVILSASSINSPKLLMLSGIGPAEHLREHGIEVVANRPGVGAQPAGPPRSLRAAGLHASDHAERASRPVGARAGSGCSGWPSAPGSARPTISRPAPSSAPTPACPIPDLQLHFLPAAVRYDGRAAATAHGFQVHIGPMRSPSRGTVRLRSGEPRAAPAIRFNYMSREEDWRDFRTAIRLTREIFAQPALGVLSAARRSRRASTRSPTRRSTISCATTWRAPTIPAAPAAWARSTT